MLLRKTKKESYHFYYNVTRLEEMNGQWLYKARKITYKDKIEEILKKNYKHKLAKHLSIKKTLSKIRENLI